LELSINCVTWTLGDKFEWSKMKEDYIYVYLNTHAKRGAFKMLN